MMSSKLNNVNRFRSTVSISLGNNFLRYEKYIQHYFVSRDFEYLKAMKKDEIEQAKVRGTNF